MNDVARLTAIPSTIEGCSSQPIPVTWQQSQETSRINPDWELPVLFENAYSCEIRVSRGEDGGFIAYVARLPGVLGQGISSVAAIADVANALHAGLVAYKEEGMPIPWREAERKTPGEEAFQVVVHA